MAGASPRPKPIAGTVTYQVQAGFDQGMRQFWQATVQGDPNQTGKSICNAILQDLTQSGMFATFAPPGATDADYRVLVTCNQVAPETVTLRMMMSVYDRRGALLFSRATDAPTGMRAWRNVAGQHVCQSHRPIAFPGDVAPTTWGFSCLVAGSTRQTLAQVMPFLRRGAYDALRR